MDPDRAVPLLSLSDTAALGGRIAAELRPGDVVALRGEMGAGKTCLTQAIVEALGSPAAVTSPTFTLVHEYGGGRLPVCHFDFHRLGSGAEALAIGWDDYLDSGAVLIVEWADLFPDLIPSHAFWWSLDARADGSRTAFSGNLPDKN